MCSFILYNKTQHNNKNVLHTINLYLSAVNVKAHVHYGKNCTKLVHFEEQKKMYFQNTLT
jgi:hypothetical protein